MSEPSSLVACFCPRCHASAALSGGAQNPRLPDSDGGLQHLLSAGLLSQCRPEEQSSLQTERRRHGSPEDVQFGVADRRCEAEALLLLLQHHNQHPPCLFVSLGFLLLIGLKI